MKKEYTLTALDRCDANCSAQAYVRSVGMSGELLFCNHHYEEIINRPNGYDKMMQFAYQIDDERDRLIENRLKED
jgi:hypothetical protein